MATYLAAQFPLTILSTDALRLTYGFPSGPTTHDVMYDVATVLLRDNGGVIFDGIHLGRRNRADTRSFAHRHAARFELLYTTATQQVIEQRLQARRESPTQTADAGKFVITPAHFEEIRRHLEEPAPDEAVWAIDTSSQPIAELLARFQERLNKVLL